MINIAENEKIFLIKRRHIFVFIFEVFPLIILLFATLFAMGYFYFYHSIETVREYLSKIPIVFDVEIIDLQINYYYLLFFILLLLILVIWQFIFIIFAHYYLDCWIITSERTIHTELRSLFSRFYSSVSHDRIQDITVDIHGFFPTIFKYGNLKIQTAGAFKSFVFRQIPDPYKSKDTLMEVSKNKKKEENINSQKVEGL